VGSKVIEEGIITEEAYQKAIIWKWQLKGGESEGTSVGVSLKQKEK